MQPFALISNILFILLLNRIMIMKAAKYEDNLLQYHVVLVFILKKSIFLKNKTNSK
jgi:hypothetical protein